VSLRDSVSHFWDCLKQKKLWELGEEVGPLTEPLERLIRIWEVLRIEEQVGVVPAAWAGGRPIRVNLIVATDSSCSTQ